MKVIVAEAKADNNKIPSDLIYKEKPLVVLSNEVLILWSGSRKEFLSDTFIGTTYYDKCTLKAREHDLHLNNNDKIEDEIVVSRSEAINLTNDLFNDNFELFNLDKEKSDFSKSFFNVVFDKMDAQEAQLKDGL